MAVEKILDFTDEVDAGYRELKEAKDILDTYFNTGAPVDFYDDGGFSIMFNTDSGYVFLTNEDGQVAMLGDDGKLHSWYYLSYNGDEGFADDLYEEFKDGDIDEEDLEELKDIFETSEDAEESWAEEVQERIDEIR